MAVEIKMPQLSDTMDAGKILSWSKQEGDQVARGDILAEVETDKANLEIECFNAGYLLKIVVPEGESASVGQPIAFIGEQGENVDNGSGSTKTSTPESGDVTPPDSGEPTKKEATTKEDTPNDTDSSTTPEDRSEPVSSATQSTGDRIKVSPLARKLADQHAVNLDSVQGSGPNGRIIKKDIEDAAKNQDTTNAPVQSMGNQQQAAASQSTSSTTDGTLTPLSKMRATIARRMQQAVTEAPHFFTNVSVDMTEAMKLRAVFKADPDLKDISINHLIIKAAGYALRREPGVNASMKGDSEIFQPNQINIGVVTAVEGGLMIPVIRSVDSLSLQDLAFETRAAIDRARAGRPSATDLSGGTFSISNMGMFGVESFTAIINPGQGAILAVGATIDTPVVKNGVIQSAPMMTVTLSVDHRIIDGTMSGTWLKHFKQALEQPAVVLL